ncbi:hypothetical protein [Arenibacter sp. ARW7G5Y1]|uniref:hypothetical protein n=1 Tax=Arenibacter sp. ARW7G5Y1 TaxID=2135619 RepID=UPI000D76C72D|nr:hypothetical protein [Arenibacter sp. ARW7G5Y1]PXX25460.1 hypothetical protein C7972_11286 [Arenibacter sp. ARW7G5Y1]|tara:strand:- start:8616 stop:9074 length:459 start_codon:yes stop_codon:yes gene_type:complete
MRTYSTIKNLAFLVVTLFLCNSCSKENDDISYDLAGSWKVIYFLDGNKKITKSEDNTWPDINNGDITTNFTAPDNNGKGTVSGISVSNAYNGEYTIQKNGDISIGPIMTTYINEPEWTKLFSIGSAQKFEIKNSNLLIYYNSRKNIIVFERN